MNPIKRWIQHSQTFISKMNILILGRTYNQHLLFEQYSKDKFIDLFNIKKGSKIIFVDILEDNRSKTQNNNGVKYIDVIGDFRNVQC